MSDLISRQAAIVNIKKNELMDLDEYRRWYNHGLLDAEISILDLPSADVVEVVRCRDCIRYDTHDKRCKYWNHGVGVDLNGFCSKGERRNDA
jgi:hypothetical protein